MNVSLQHPFPLLDLDVLRTFIAIADAGSFAAAAEAVYRTPSAVSMQIKKLEEMLGRAVFIRDSRSVKLTRDGEILLEHGRRLLALNRELVAKIRAPDIAGEVRHGAPDDASERFLPGMLSRFGESKKVDIALITCSPSHPGSEHAEVLLRERLVWAVRKGGVAAEKNPLPVSVWEEGCIWRKAGLEGLEKQGRAYRIAFHSAYISGQRAAILADLAVAPLPVSSLVGDIIEAGPEYGLPPLPDYTLGMIVAEDASAPVLAAADHLRASFAGRRPLAAAAE
ncbi:MAG: LysR family transcriptional regulator [Nitratireductor sp.]|nr:LysR family transcriptional regulator [Nitratireductor sp.]